MRTRSWLLLAIGFGAVCLFLAAIVLAASYVVIARRSVTTALVLPSWGDPSKVDKLKIDPILSVATLAGTTELTAITSMQSHGEIDAAYAATVYATGLTDRQRLGQLLLIGERYAAAENVAATIQTHQAVMDVVALSPLLSDFERTEALAQAATALYKIKETHLAGLALDAGRDVAMQSPFLKDANRFTLLNKLLFAAQQSGDAARIKKLNDDRSNFVDAGDTSAPPLEPPNPLPAIEVPAKNDAVAAAQAKRVAAAQKIAQLTNVKNVPDALVEELNNALFDEDDARAKVYSAPTAKLTLAQKIALVRDQVDWLTLKHRIARKAFGLSIVPEWEDSEGDIRAQLIQAVENFYVLRNEQAVALPQAGDITLAVSYLLRQQILAGRLGLYPDFPESNLADDLNDKTDELITRQPKSALRVKVETSNDQYYYHLVNDDVWNGQPEAVPSKPAVKSKATATAVRGAPPVTPQSTRAPVAPAANPTAQLTAPPAPPTQAPPTSTPAPPPPTNTPAPLPPTNTPVRLPTPVPSRAYP